MQTKAQLRFIAIFWITLISFIAGLAIAWSYPQSPFDFQTTWIMVTAAFEIFLLHGAFGAVRRRRDLR